jgi:hypothetical protein
MADYLELNVTGMLPDALCDLINERLNDPGKLYRRIDFVQRVEAGKKRLFMQTWMTEVDFSEYEKETEQRI